MIWLVYYLAFGLLYGPLHLWLTKVHRHALRFGIWLLPLFFVPELNVREDLKLGLRPQRYLLYFFRHMVFYNFVFVVSMCGIYCLQCLTAFDVPGEWRFLTVLPGVVFSGFAFLTCVIGLSFIFCLLPYVISIWLEKSEENNN